LLEAGPVRGGLVVSSPFGEHAPEHVQVLAAGTQFAQVAAGERLLRLLDTDFLIKKNIFL
jgi:hypothetical protein